MEKTPIEVLDSVLQDVRELEDFLTFCQASIANMEGAEKLHVVTRKAVERIRGQPATEDPEKYEERLRLAQKTTARAIEEQKAGYLYLYRLGIIWLWAIFEASFDDFAIAFLHEDDRWLKIDALKKLKGSIVEFASASESQRAEFLLDAVKESIAAPLKMGAGRFEAVFNLIGIGGAVNDEVARVLVEFSASRNLLVHRRGLVDRNFLKLCPWMNCVVGSVLIVNPAKYRTFSAALAWYNLEMIGRLSRCSGPQNDIEVIDGQDDFLKQMRVNLGLKEQMPD